MRSFGLSAACDVTNFNGLNGRSASEILYQIIMQSPLDNNTFFGNNSHVTYLSDFEASIGPISFQIGSINIPGSKHMAPNKV